MTNEQETIDGVKGEWRTVTKPSEVTVGQMVRMVGQSACFGYDKRNIQVVTSIKSNRVFVNNFDNIDDDLLDGYWKQVQAFFPLPVSKSSKVAKVIIKDTGLHYWWTCKISVEIESLVAYSKRSHAIRGARRFCKAIGYECEIVK